MKLENCTCSGDALMFREQTMTPDRYRQVKRHHREKAEEFEKKSFTFFWTKCLSCGAMAEGENNDESAVKNWGEQ